MKLVNLAKANTHINKGPAQLSVTLAFTNYKLNLVASDISLRIFNITNKKRREESTNEKKKKNNGNY